MPASGSRSRGARDRPRPCAGSRPAPRTRAASRLVLATQKLGGVTGRGTEVATDLKPTELARSVAIIMDGNGRWAERRGLPVADGHREGARALRRTVEAAIDLGVRSLAVYAFSTENWARPPEEVESIMELLDDTIDRELPDLARQGVRTRFIGRRDRVPEPLRAKMAALEEETARNDRLSLWIAFDYGSRAELVEAARKLVADGVGPQDVTEAALAERLF